MLKVTEEECEGIDAKKFPCLMKGRSGAIYIMTTEVSGVAITESYTTELGSYNPKLDSSNLVPYFGKVTISETK